MEALFLSRVQFAFVVTFHVMFPAFTIGLSSWLAFLEWRWVRTHHVVWRDLYFFWQKIFALCFGLGVVAGIVMAFQFGTNWTGLSRVAGSVIGPLLTYEVLTAFYLEAAFLGVMLFGWGRLSERVHLFATAMVALGTLFSTFWILSSNSFLHTPAGYAVVDGVIHPVDWWKVVFNPSFPYRLAHMALGSFLTTCFIIGGTGAWYLLKGLHVEAARKMLACATVFAAVALPVQIFAGDQHGLNTLEHQPIKLAAMEGHWRSEGTGKGVPLLLFAIPDEGREANRFELAIPRLGSLILTHSRDGEIPALTSVPASERPPVMPVFFPFRIMVGLGMLMLALAWGSAWALRRGVLFERRWLLCAWKCMLPAGLLALIAGWYVTEIGRQPYVVYGLLRTADALGVQTPWMTALSMGVYVLGYAFVFGWGLWYLARIGRAGPGPHDPDALFGVAHDPIRHASGDKPRETL